MRTQSPLTSGQGRSVPPDSYISSSQPPEHIVPRHRHELPRILRVLLRSLGKVSTDGSSTLSFLLFEPDYCNELIELGYKDTMEQKEAILRLLGAASKGDL